MPYILDPQKHGQHYLQDATRHPMHHHPSVRERILMMPTCQRCGAVAFRHRRPDNVLCPICGHEGPPGPPLVQRWREASGNPPVPDQAAEPDDSGLDDLPDGGVE